MRPNDPEDPILRSWFACADLRRHIAQTVEHGGLIKWMTTPLAFDPRGRTPRDFGYTAETERELAVLLGRDNA